jgi:hypothetical protein
MVADANIPSPPTSPSPQQSEKRQWVRHAVGDEVTCHLQAGPAFDFWAVRVLNLSAGGISLVLDRLVPTGKVLTVELHHAGRGFSCQRPIRIIYTFKDSSGAFTVGGAFSPDLSEQDIQGLV